jgi:hypothetical protein
MQPLEASLNLAFEGGMDRRERETKMTTEELVNLLDEASRSGARLYLRTRALETENELLRRRIEKLEADLPASDSNVEG